MAEIRYTRNLFLRCMNVIYLFAFASLYIQIPGLYGKNGVLPAHVQLETKDTKDLVRNVHNKPTLLWLAPYIGLDTEYMMDALALIGIFLSFTGFISQKFCSKPMFAALWSLYYSLYQVGQTFMWFQWDILLLEVGFLCVVVSPLRYKPTPRRRPPPAAPHEPLTYWLVTWLLFRLMFSSGIVKLTSGCPQWWGLTALKIHFQSMCLPAPLAWYCYHLPEWFLELNTVFANVCEIFIPPLFFFPIQSVRTVAFWIQMFLQVCIIITGNFNFFNFLTMVLCLSLVNDQFFLKKQEKTGTFVKILSYLICLTVYAMVIYATYILYSLKLQPDGSITSKIAFSKEEFDWALSRGLPAVIVVGLVSLSVNVLRALVSAASHASPSLFSKLFTMLATIFYITVSAFIFADSLVPFSTLHPAGNATVLPPVREWHTKLSHLHLTNPYGLFRRMTGVGGRPEIIILGSNDLKGPWAEYHFLYKPGDVNRSLPFVAPHQPRLDWQMWFASLGTYHQNPWIMSLAYRILTGQPEVLALLDNAHNPFPKAPPKYLKADLYHYHYTSWGQRYKSAWWTSERVGEYFPVFSKDHPPLLDYLRNLKILSTGQLKSTVNPYAKTTLDQLRAVMSQVDGGILLWSLFTAGIAIIMAGRWAAPAHPPTSRPKKNN